MHVGLIGARGFGQNHLRAMQESPHVEAVSLCGRDTAALEPLRERFPKVRGLHGQPSALLADPSVDVVDIVLPHHLHLPVALEAFDRGKHVIVEKPPARTPDEFRTMLSAADAAGKRLFTVMNLLFDPLHWDVRRALDAGAIGRPFFSFEVVFSPAYRTYLDPGAWRADRERCGGGLPIDGGFHAVYRQLFFLETLGAPTWLLADAAQVGVEMPQKGEDFLVLTLAYAAGARVQLTGTWTARAGLGRMPHGIAGTEGTLVFTGDPEQPAVIRRPDAADEPLPPPAGPRGFAETASACVGHYLECLATGSEPWVGNDLAMLTLEVLTTAYRSAEEGRRLPLEGSFRTRIPGVG